jgi:hypothetical protein
MAAVDEVSYNIHGMVDAQSLMAALSSTDFLFGVGLLKRSYNQLLCTLLQYQRLSTRMMYYGNNSNRAGVRVSISFFTGIAT